MGLDSGQAGACSLVPLIAAILLTPLSLAQPLPDPHETYGDDPGQPVEALRTYTPRGQLAQVNVDGLGFNIVGDAANEPSLAIDPTAPNRMVIGWRQFDTITSDFREAGYAWSNDGGRSWHMGEIEPGILRTDPVLRAADDGTIYYTMLNVSRDGELRCDVYRSRDGGVQWSGPTFAFGGDKAWIAVDRTNSPGRGIIYQVWGNGNNTYAPNTFNRSTDGGVSFTEPIPIPLTPRAGTMAVGPLGQIYIIGYEAQFVSTENPWEASPTFTSRIIPGMTMGAIPLPNRGGIPGQMQVVVDAGTGPRRGWIYVLGSRRTTTPSDPAEVLMVRSTDGGVTWSAPIRMNPDPPATASYQWFGTVSIAPNGRLDVMWNDTSESGVLNLSRTVYSSSADGGATWTEPMVLTGQWDSFVGWPRQNKIGDYYDMESDNLGVNVAFAATLNGEQDIFHRRIGPYDCNRNEVDDAIETATGAEADCNANQIPDSCELAAGAARDLNRNGTLDVCERACDADFDHDGDTGTDSDIEAFFRCLAGDCCALCGSPDFNGDGDTGTSADIESFLSVLGGGGC